MFQRVKCVDNFDKNIPFGADSFSNSWSYMKLLYQRNSAVFGSFQEQFSELKYPDSLSSYTSERVDSL